MSALPRRFDWDAARRRHAEGESIGSIARSFGVSRTAVARVVDPLIQVALAASRARVQTSGTCVDCGEPCSFNPTAQRARPTRCAACSYKQRAKVVRDERGVVVSAFCAGCDEWLDAACFAPDPRRPGRGVSKACRDCRAAMRRAYRALHPEQAARERERKRHAREASP